ncbi:MAG: hypothetical protein IKU13_06305, partial [Clostridia bacterium]|nr:hypothetical protein [Clostridia bacterium]
GNNHTNLFLSGHTFYATLFFNAFTLLATLDSINSTFISVSFSIISARKSSLRHKALPADFCQSDEKISHC